MCIAGLIEGLVVLEESLGLGVEAVEPQSAGGEIILVEAVYVLNGVTLVLTNGDIWEKIG